MERASPKFFANMFDAIQGRDLWIIKRKRRMNQDICKTEELLNDL
jgi:hypothetical protein